MQSKLLPLFPLQVVVFPRNRSEIGRLKQLTEFLSRYTPKLRAAARMKKLAPLNGHGLKPPGM